MQARQCCKPPELFLHPQRHFACEQEHWTLPLCWWRHTFHCFCGLEKGHLRYTWAEAPLYVVASTTYIHNSASVFIPMRHHRWQHWGCPFISQSPLSMSTSAGGFQGTLWGWSPGGDRCGQLVQTNLLQVTAREASEKLVKGSSLQESWDHRPGD